MAVDEAARHRLHDRLEQVLGVEEATILMAHLPPVGWADVATKRDLDALQEANRREHEVITETFRGELQAITEANRLEHELLRQSIETSEQRILATVRADTLQQTRTMMFALATAVISVGGLAFAAARLG